MAHSVLTKNNILFHFLYSAILYLLYALPLLYFIVSILYPLHALLLCALLLCALPLYALLLYALLLYALLLYALPLYSLLLYRLEQPLDLCHLISGSYHNMFEHISFSFLL